MSLIKINIQFDCGPTPLGGLQVRVTSNVTRYATPDEAPKIVKWAKGRGYTATVSLLSPSTLDEVESDISEYIGSGAWKP